MNNEPIKPYCNTCKVWYDDPDGFLKHKGLCMDARNYLLTDIAIDMVDLVEFKTQGYNQFIESVIEMSNSLHTPLTVDYFNEIIEDEKEIIINIPTPDEKVIQPSFGKRCTNGELLYNFSQYLSDYDDTEKLFGNHSHFDGFIRINNGSYNINYG